MFNEYYIPGDPPPVLLFDEMIDADHVDLLTALITSRTAVLTFMVTRSMPASELNKAVNRYRIVEHAVQQAVASNPAITKPTVVSGMMSQYSITQGLAQALLTAMQVRNTRGSDWDSLKAAIVDTIEVEE